MCAVIVAAHLNSIPLNNREALMWLRPQTLLVGVLTASAMHAQDSGVAAYLRFHTEAPAGDSALVLQLKPDPTRYRFAVKPALDLRIVARALASPNTVGGGWDVIVEFTQDGRARFQEMTAKIVGQHLGIVIDDKLTDVPIIQTPLRAARIPVAQGKKTEAAAARLAAEINRRIEELHPKGTE
jgi:preprotein translocase subunit SecD